jgi:uncharacterized protein (DUF983 family)
VSGVEPEWWAAALRCRCPRCGEGRVFAGLLRPNAACPRCGLDLHAQDVGDGPVAFVVLIVGCLVIVPAFVIEARGGWPVWLHMVVWLPLTVVLCIALIRPFKAGLIALHYRHRHDTGER